VLTPVTGMVARAAGKVAVVGDDSEQASLEVARSRCGAFT